MVHSPAPSDRGDEAPPSHPLETTVIGSFPKPADLPLVDWFQTGHESCACTEKMTSKINSGELTVLEQAILKATQDIIKAQHDCGVHVVTDGEVRRENYIHHLARQIEGIDFEHLTETVYRNGALKCNLPTLVGEIKWRHGQDYSFCSEEWRRAKEAVREQLEARSSEASLPKVCKTSTSADAKAALQQKAQQPCPLKYTLPGPMTIIGTLNTTACDTHPYQGPGGKKMLATHLAERVLNPLIQELAAAGCCYIQVDEPLFARQPDDALEYGIPLLEEVFKGVCDGGCGKVRRDVHICCGYPTRLDDHSYLKADPNCYLRLAPALDACAAIDAVSLEDAHRPNDLAALLPLFRRLKVILGTVRIADSCVETPEAIEARLREALRHIPAERLVVAPDCGLGFLPLPILKAKLTHMCEAARRAVLP